MLRRNVILVGFMGTGKSSSGRALARRLRMRFVDLDRIVERRAGKTIARIFAEDGEAAFRALEHKVAGELATQRGLVVATGGGVVLDPRNVEALERAGTVICLVASVEAIMARVSNDTTRPLLAGDRSRERVVELLEARRPIYESFAHRIDTSQLAPRDVATRICGMLEELSGHGLPTMTQGVDTPLPVPLRLAPAFRDYIWGGTRLGGLFPRVYPPGRCAEAWVVSDRPDGMCRVTEGPAAGLSLGGLAEREGPRLLGTRVPGTRFPLLIKVLDAATSLSIHVHPDDERARAQGGEAKSEAWHILHAEPGARLWCGLRPGVQAGELRDAAREDRLPELMRTMTVTAGDTIYCPGGLVHAIGEGILLLEVQQNSNTTYRLFDWGRREADGSPRALHIEEALRVIDWAATPQVVTARDLEERLGTDRWTAVLRTPHFALECAEVRDGLDGANDGGAFHVLFASRGAARVEGAGFRTALDEGAALLLPAALAAYRVHADAGPTRILRLQP